MNEIVFDIEVAPNRVMVGIGNEGKTHIIESEEHKPMSADSLQLIDNHMNSGTRCIGYNNNKYDSFILSAILNGASPEVIYKLSMGIIHSDREADGKKKSPWKVAKEFGFSRSPFVELDLTNYAKRARLKQYELRLGINLEDLPFDPNAPIPESQLATVREYLQNDIKATEALHQAVAPEIALREELATMFDLDVAYLCNKTAASAATDIIVSEYLKLNPMDDEARLKKQRERFWNCSFRLTLEPWVRAAVAGTRAESLLDEIQGSRFVIKGGKRIGPIDAQWSAGLEWVRDNTSAVFGVGGIHSQDETWSYKGIGADVASLYPRLVLMPGGSPEHLDPVSYRQVFKGILDRRLRAKAQGDKTTANALKLVLNSGGFGVQGEMYNTLFSPHSFLHITLSGQLLFLAITDRITGKEKALPADADKAKSITHTHKKEYISEY